MCHIRNIFCTGHCQDTSNTELQAISIDIEISTRSQSLVTKKHDLLMSGVGHRKVGITDESLAQFDKIVDMSRGLLAQDSCSVTAWPPDRGL